MSDPNVFAQQWDLEFPDPRWPGRMISTMELPDVAEHVDAGNTLVFHESGDVKAFPPGVEIPFVDAVTGAMEAGDGA